MKKITLFTFFAILLLISNNNLLAQDSEDKPSIGLSAVFQDSQFDIVLPVWISESVSIAPAVNFKYIKDAGTNYGFGILLKNYLKNTKVSPFVAGRAGILISSPKEGDGTTDTILGIAFGGEYFIDEKFSFGIEAQINMSFSDEKSFRFANPGGTNINTATAIYGTIYF